jgi:hypothetical protein
VSLAYANRTRGCQFNVFPGMPAQDVVYTFHNGEAADSLGMLVAVDAAQSMQRWFVDFAMKGEERVKAVLPLYGEGGAVVNGTESEAGVGFEIVGNPARNERCRFWLG